MDSNDTLTLLLGLAVAAALVAALLLTLLRVVHSDGRLTAFGRLYHRPAGRAPRSHHDPF